jgi:hypothetical protein
MMLNSMLIIRSLGRRRFPASAQAGLDGMGVLTVLGEPGKIAQSMQRS